MLIIPQLKNINSIDSFIETYRNMYNEQPSSVTSTNGNLYDTKQFLIEILFAIKILKQYGTLKIPVNLFRNRLEEDLVALLKNIFSEYIFRKNVYTFKYYTGPSIILIDKLSLILVSYNNRYTPHKKLNL